MDILFAPMITVEATYALERLIEEHHELYLEVSVAGVISKKQCN